MDSDEGNETPGKGGESEHVMSVNAALKRVGNLLQVAPLSVARSCWRV